MQRIHNFLLVAVLVFTTTALALRLPSVPRSHHIHSDSFGSKIRAATRCIALPSTKEDDPDLKSLGKPGMKGFYVRPSRAIEKGGGFFVPGLEGERIRIVSGIALLALYAVNLLGSQTQDMGLSISTYTGLFISVLLLLQGITGLFPEEPDITPLKNKSISGTTGYLTGIQYSGNINPSSVSSLSKLSQTIVQTCEQLNYVLILSGISSKDKGAAEASAEPEVVFEFGPVGSKPSELNINRSTSSAYAEFCTPNKVTLMDRESFKNRYAELFRVASFPRSMASIAVVEDVRGWTWFMGSDAPRDSIAKQELWLESLLYAPVQ